MNQKKKGSCGLVLLIPIVVIFLITGGCAACFCSSNNSSTTQTQEVKEDKKVEEEVIKEEPKDFQTILIENIGDSNLADRVYSILVNDIGFEKMEFISKVSGTGNYKIEADSVDVIITAMPANEEESEYIRVFQPDGAIFYEDGQVLMSGAEVRKEVEHYHHTDDYYIIAQYIIKDAVNTPNKMKFAGQFMDAEDIGYGWKDDYVVVKSWVDIQNNFGTYDRYDFIVEFIPTDLKNYQYEVVYVNIGNEQIGTLVDVDTLHIIKQ